MIPARKFFSVAVAGVCALVLVFGCKKTEAAALPVAPTVAAALQLAPSKPLKKGIDAMPELANPATPAQQKINAAMKSADAAALSMLKDCKSYKRSVQPTMLGPGYFSVWVNESWECSAYPNVSISVRLFDLNTGEAVDWSKLASGAGVKTYSDSGADGKQGAPLALVYPALKAMYLKDPDNAGECQTAYGDDQAFMIWPEAKSGTLKVEAFDLPHVVQACANDMTLTIDQAKALGFNADFLNAVLAASKQPGADKLTATPQ
jgi:hypothetical protein